jgi:hypothetical protein
MSETRHNCAALRGRCGCTLRCRTGRRGGGSIRTASSGARPSAGSRAGKSESYHAITRSDANAGLIASSVAHRGLALSRAEATEMGERMMAEGWLESVDEGVRFSDSYQFYRFCWDRVSESARISHSPSLTMSNSHKSRV